MSEHHDNTPATHHGHSLEQRVAEIENRMNSLMILDPKLWKRALAAYGYYLLAAFMIYGVLAVFFIFFILMVGALSAIMGN